MKKIIPVLIALLLVSGCTSTKKNKRTTTIQSSSNEQSSSEAISSSSQDVTSSSATSSSSSGTSSSKPSSSVTTSSSHTTSSSASSSSRPSSSSTSSTSGQHLPTETLPNNLKAFYAPSNTPVELTTHLSTPHWWENDFKEDLPSSDWSYIYGNNNSRGDWGDHPQPQFYSSNNGNPGGLRMDQERKGFQSCLFHHTGEKLEIRLGISQVNDAKFNSDTSVPTGYFLFYDKNAHYLDNLTYTLEHDKINSNTTEIKFYVTGTTTENVAYLEFRLNTLPYKGQTSYNFGVGYLNINSWERA